jgi:hypothetical protein
MASWYRRWTRGRLLRLVEEEGGSWVIEKWRVIIPNRIDLIISKKRLSLCIPA